MIGMRLKTLCVAACFAASIAAAPALAQAPARHETRYTDLVGGRCRFVAQDRETGEDALKRCPGHGEFELETLSSHTRVSLSFRFSRTQRVPDVVAGWSLGKSVEWRGIKSNKGFQPYAAIVRVLMKDPEAATRRADGEVLAVLRVDPAEAEVCPIAYVDARANRRANELARGTADRLGPTYLCDSDKPAVTGARTRWTDALMRPE
jgi:hypothetical protein